MGQNQKGEMVLVQILWLSVIITVNKLAIVITKKILSIDASYVYTYSKTLNTNYIPNHTKC